ncbi:EamA family transporter [Marinobacter sp.]|uniref:EamA family transporter n=1 Tax=Marinobacter sp. TaxID=50741 RepID=UPI003850395A
MNEAEIALTASVLMHVVWNMLARHQAANTFALWWALAAHLLILGVWGFPALVLEAHWTPGFSALLATSAVANGIYFMGLRRAYTHAPVALVYPLVRSSPLLIAVWGLLLFGEGLTAMVWTGIAISVAGLLFMSTGDRQGTEKRAVPWALLAMLATSAYSISDKAATASIESFRGLVGFVSVGYFTAWIALSVEHFRTAGRWLPAARPAWYVILTGGLCVGLAYALVIHAMRFMPAAEAVAYTNAGIVLACLASIFIFRERHCWQRRLTGAGIILSGLLLMRLAG